MELVKTEVEKVTRNAFKTAMLAMLGLRIAGCPYVDWYEFVENFMIDLDKHREILGLQPIVPEELKQHMLSKKVALDFADAELTPEQLSQVEALVDSFKKAKDGKGPIGFKLEDLKYDPTKVN